MRKSKFTETQIVGILKDAESGVPVVDLLRKHSVSKATLISPDHLRRFGPASRPSPKATQPSDSGLPV